MMRELKRHSGLLSLRYRTAIVLRRLATVIDGQPLYPPIGYFQIRAGQETVKVEVVSYPSEIGERLFLNFGEYSDAAANLACSETVLMFEDSKRFREYDPDESTPESGDQMGSAEMISDHQRDTASSDVNGESTRD
jgi:hypothetical protein